VAFHLSPGKTLFSALIFLAAGSLAAHADSPASPPAPAILAAPAAPPTAAALESAKAIILTSGMKRSFDLVIPQTFGELDRSVTTTRPELKDSLHTVLLSLLPEFRATEDNMVNQAAQALAKQMSEQELKDTAAFFSSPSGMKYVQSEPTVFNEIIASVQAWREKMSVDVLARAHEEMKKKGQDF
jgi:hypothetical protein